MKKIYSFFLAIVLANAALATTHIINQSSFTFSPATVNVSVGDTVQWVWSSGTHTTTSVSIPSGAMSWNSPLSSSSTSFSYKVEVAGNYGYKCTPHASMGMVGAFVATAASSVNDVQAPEVVVASFNSESDLLNVRIANSKSNTLQVDVFDFSGRHIAQLYSGPIATEFEMASPIDNATRGINFVRITLNGRAITKKIVIQ
jgi:plastocyanin